MKITNDCSLKGLSLELIFIAFILVPVFILCTLMFNILTLCIFIIILFIDILCINHIKKLLDFDKYKNNDIKYVETDQNEFKILKKDNNVLLYNKSDINKININIVTSMWRSKWNYHNGIKYVVIDFFMHDGNKYEIYVHKASFNRSMNIIYKIISLVKNQSKISYKFHGYGDTSEILEKIKFYEQHNIKILKSAKERKEIMHSVFAILLIGFVIAIYYVISNPYNIKSIIKFLLIFCTIPVLMSIPVLIDNINIRKSTSLTESNINE